MATELVATELGPKNDAHAALNEITGVMQRLSNENRLRLLKTLATFYGAAEAHQKTNLVEPVISNHAPSSMSRDPVFSGEKPPSPKDFIFGKEPQTDVDRIACLAYYLSNHRKTRYFKTADINVLNTEAAGRKFSNPASSFKNAVIAGYLVDSTEKGSKQLSPFGEQYVKALPNRQQAKVVIEQYRPKRTKTKRKIRKT